MKIKPSIILVLTTSLLMACQGEKDTQATRETVQLTPINQTSLNALSSSLQVTYEQLSNRVSDQCDAKRADGNCYKARLIYSVPKDYLVSDFEIVFSHITPIQKSLSTQFRIEHINGDLHRVIPTEEFSGFTQLQSIELPFIADFWSVSESDPLPNHMLYAKGLEPKVIQSTLAAIDDETGLEFLPFVKTYTDETHQFKRSKSDKTVWANAHNLGVRLKAQQQADTDISSEIIPKPKSVTPINGAPIDLAKGYRLTLNQVPMSAVSTAFERLNSFGVKPSQEGLEISFDSLSGNKITLGAYELTVTESGIKILANDPSGWFYGVQSVAALIQLPDLTIPQLKVVDEPRYPFRGLLLDVARNFRSQEFVFKVLDQMAAYKMNKLHFHLADDEGWRLQIPDLPELTDVSGFRCFDSSERECLQPQLGAGVEKASPVNGYYNVEQYQQILNYASERHIQVIPSLDMPGHSRAAVTAMEARFKAYSEKEMSQKASEYRLVDPEDTTQYSSIQYYSDNTLNVCLESTYRFIDKVMDNVKAIHQQAGHPLTRYHIGADETAGAWKDSPACQTLIAENDDISSVEDLGPHFIQRVAKILERKGIEVAAWSDGLEHVDPAEMPKVVQANAWVPLQWQGHQSAHEMVNRDWQVVVSSPDFTYFDFPYEPDPKEHGFYWASRHTNTQKVFQFMVGNLPANALIWGNREDIDYVADDTASDSQEGKGHHPLGSGKQVHGLQGQLWSENLRTDAMAEFKLFPRLLALAERAWHKPQWEVQYDYQGTRYARNGEKLTDTIRTQIDEDWARFSRVLSDKAIPKLEVAGVFYRLPTVGVIRDSDKLMLKTLIPNIPMEYRYEGQKDWQQYSQPIEAQDVWVRSHSKTTDRKGRALLYRIAE